MKVLVHALVPHPQLRLTIPPILSPPKGGHLRASSATPGILI